MSHRVHHDLYRAPKGLSDPGNAGTIRVTQDLQIMEMVSVGEKTRTLANPTKAGLRFVLRMLTDGGNITATATNGLNVTGNTAAVFADVGDLLSLVSVSHTTGYRWEIEINTGSVSLS